MTGPEEADAVPVIDADGMLALAISPQRYGENMASAQPVSEG
jgi:hypothetical protein